MSQINIHTLISEPNHKRVLNLIRIHQGVSGASLSRLTELQPSTIHYILQHLKGKGLVDVYGSGASTQAGGKKPNMWCVQKDTAYIIGLEVLKFSIRYIVLDLAGVIVFEGEKKYPQPINGDNIVEHCTHLLTEIVSNDKIDNHLIVGCGIAITGLVKGDESTIIYSRELAIHQLRLSEALSKSFLFSIYLINDANAGALSHYWFGHTEEVADFIYLGINATAKDIGAGVMINRKLYTGHHGIAGEISNALPSATQLFGEAISLHGDSSLIMEVFLKNDVVTLNDTIDCFFKGCNASKYILEKFTDAIASEIINICGILNPEKVIIGGDVTQMKMLIDDYITPKVTSRYLKLYAYSESIPKIELSDKGRFAVSYGAAAMVLMKIFN